MLVNNYNSDDDDSVNNSDLFNNIIIPKKEEKTMKYMLLYRKKKVGWKKIYGLKCDEIDLSLIIRNIHKEKIFKEKKQFSIKDTLLSCNLFYNGYKNKLLKMNNYYCISSKYSLKNIKNKKNIRQLEIKFNNKNIYTFKSIKPFKKNGKLYIEYFYIDPHNDFGVCSSKNLIFDDYHQNRIFELCRVEGNLMMIAYREPFTELYAFLTGASLFSS